MSVLIVTPLQEEQELLLQCWRKQNLSAQSLTVGRLPAFYFPDLDITLACGGLGKTQFGLQTQHVLDFCPDIQVLICAGAAGALAEHLQVGDVIVATETVEHDCIHKFVKRPPPRFEGSPLLIQQIKQVSTLISSFNLYFGVIASGDEDIIERERAEEIRSLTGAVAVAWEGAGGARSGKFSQIPYLEIRGISDNANHDAPSDFETNLATVMENISLLVLQWIGQTRRS